MARKPSAKKIGKAVQGMLEALKFIEPASKEIGQINQTHCMLAGGWAAAFDGVVMMAHKIDNDMVAFPHTKRLIGALSKCDEQVQITQLDSGRLGIKSGKFSAFVPCIDGGLMAITPPDAPQYDLNDGVLASLGIVGVVAKENAPRMVQASVLLRANSAVATDGHMILESWHGTQLPTVVLPKVFVQLLLKIGKKATKLGVGPNTCTIHFEDGSLIRTQLYTDPYPDVDRLMATPNNAFPIPAELWTALDKLDSQRNETKDVYFNATAAKLQTDPDPNVGASYDFEHPLPDGVRLNIELLRRFAPHAKAADWKPAARPTMAMLFGDNFRGAIMHKDAARVAPPVSNETTMAYTAEQIAAGLQQMGANTLDDEIPF